MCMPIVKIYIHILQLYLTLLDDILNKYRSSIEGMNFMGWMLQLV